jgi:hypothetical protein
VPADPYTLGIGVEIDESATERALGRLTKSLERGAEKATDTLGTVSRGLSSLFIKSVSEAKEGLTGLFEGVGESWVAASAAGPAFGGLFGGIEEAGARTFDMFADLDGSVGELTDHLLDLGLPDLELPDLEVPSDAPAWEAPDWEVPNIDPVLFFPPDWDEILPDLEVPPDVKSFGEQVADVGDRVLSTGRSIAAGLLDVGGAIASAFAGPFAEPLSRLKDKLKEAGGSIKAEYERIKAVGIPTLPEVESPEENRRQSKLLTGDMPIANIPLELPPEWEAEPVDDLGAIEAAFLDAEKAAFSLDVMSKALKEAEASAAAAAEPLIDIAVGRSPSHLDRMYAGANRAGAAIQRLGGTLTDLGRTQYDFLKPAEELESLTQKIAVTMGGGRGAAKGLRSEILDLSLSTGFSADQVGGLATSLASTGQTLGTFSASTQQALIVLDTQFGVTGEQSAKMSASISHLGGNFEALLGDATEFTEDFGMPGVFAELPELIENARTATLTFSASVTGSQEELIASSMNMAGTMAKAFGTTFADGLKRAQQSMDKLRGAAQQDSDVFLGLGDDFSGLTMAIMQTGTGLHSAMDIVRGAGKGDLGSLEQLATIRDRMPEGVMKDRFMRQLQKELPADMLALVNDTDRLHEAMTRQSDAEALNRQPGIKGFNALGDSIRDTVGGFREMYNNAINTAKAILGASGVTDIFRDVLASLSKTFTGFATRLKDWTRSAEFQETMESWKPIITSVGKAVVTFGAIVGPILTGVGGVVLGVTGALTGARSIIGALTGDIAGTGKALTFFDGMIGKIGGGIFKVFSKAGPIGIAIGAIFGIKTAFTDMAEMLGNPNATGMEKWGAVFRGTLKGIGEFVNTMLLGIPGWIADMFFPSLEAEFDAGWERLWGSFTSAAGSFSVTDALSSVMSKVGDWLGNLSQWMDESATPWLESLYGSIGETLGSVMVGLGELAFDAMWTAFRWMSGIALAEGIYDLMFDAGESGVEGLWDSFTKYLGGLGDVFLSLNNMVVKYSIAGMRGLAKGILGAFGVSFDSVETKFGILWARISRAASGIWDFITDAVDVVTAPLRYIYKGFAWLFSGIGELAGKAWDFIAGGAAKLWGKIMPHWEKDSSAVSGFFSGVGKWVNDWFVEPISGAFTWVKNAVVGAFTFVSNYVKGAWDKIGQGASVIWGFVTDVGAVKDQVTLLVGSMVEAIQVRIATFVGNAKMAWAAISAAFSNDFSGIKIFALTIAKDISVTFFGMAKSVVTSLADMARPFARFIPGGRALVDGLESGAAAIDAISTKTSAALDGQIATAQAAAAATGSKMAAIQAETDKEIAGIHERAAADRTAIHEKAALRNAAEAEEDAAFEREMAALEEKAAAEQGNFEARQENALAASRWRQTSQTQVEQALQNLGTDSVGADRASANEATGHLRDFMSEQVRTISDQVAKGALTSEQAAARLQEAAGRGLEESRAMLRVRAPGDVADSARGPATPPPRGLNQDAMQQMLKNLRGETAQQLKVTFSGDGSVTRALAINAQSANFSANGGRV